MFISLSAVSMPTALKYRRNWNKFSPSVKLLQSFMPKVVGGGAKAGYRLYLEEDRVQRTVTVPLAVRHALKREGYVATDYLAKKCVKIDDKDQKRTYNIGKIIANHTDAKMAFDNDPQLANSKANQIDFVISCHPYDVIGMSTGRSWDKTSCMRLDDGISNVNSAGSNNRYVSRDVAEGTWVAYAVRGDDSSIRKPLCRVLIKPYKDSTGDVLYRMENKVYGSEVHGFVRAVSKFLHKVNQRASKGHYRLTPGLYDDSKAGKVYHDPAAPFVEKERAIDSKNLDSIYYEAHRYTEPELVQMYDNPEGRKILQGKIDEGIVSPVFAEVAGLLGLRPTVPLEKRDPSYEKNLARHAVYDAYATELLLKRSALNERNDTLWSIVEGRYAAPSNLSPDWLPTLKDMHLLVRLFPIAGLSATSVYKNAPFFDDLPDTHGDLDTYNEIIPPSKKAIVAALMSPAIGADYTGAKAFDPHDYITHDMTEMVDVVQQRRLFRLMQKIGNERTISFMVGAACSTLRAYTDVRFHDDVSIRMIAEWAHKYPDVFRDVWDSWEGTLPNLLPAFELGTLVPELQSVLKVDQVYSYSDHFLRAFALQKDPAHFTDEKLNYLYNLSNVYRFLDKEPVISPVDTTLLFDVPQSMDSFLKALDKFPRQVSLLELPGLANADTGRALGNALTLNDISSRRVVEIAHDITSLPRLRSFLTSVLTAAGYNIPDIMYEYSAREEANRRYEVYTEEVPEKEVDENRWGEFYDEVIEENAKRKDEAHELIKTLSDIMMGIFDFDSVDEDDWESEWEAPFDYFVDEFPQFDLDDESQKDVWLDMFEAVGKKYVALEAGISTAIDEGL